MAQVYNVAECEKNRRGGFWMRLVQIVNDGCAPHVLADWTAVPNITAAKRYAALNDATLSMVSTTP